MSTAVVLPPDVPLRADGAKSGGWWHRADDGERIVCDLCPRRCALKPGDRGFCFVRQHLDDEVVLTTYGRSTGFCVDPIEKKPLNHFLPGTSVLSFGTAGCNLGCKFCQNWSISKSREIDKLSENAGPEQIARAAVALGCRSVAFTYNDPIVWAEYAIDTARACRAAGVRSVAVTAGYITPEAREPFFREMDAANVDLKGFTESFYRHLTLSHLEPVLDTLRWLKHETDVWFEVTNLVIPGENDDRDEIRRMCAWFAANLGPDVPLHFTAFHPDFRLQHRPATPPETLVACHEIARSFGLRYVYTGNVHDAARQSTPCPGCGGLVIERDWYVLGRHHLDQGRCGHCGHAIAGRFEAAPGDWGPRRLPVRIGELVPPQVPASSASPAPGASAMSVSPVSSPALVVPSPEQGRVLVEAAGGFVLAAVIGRQWQPADPSLAGLARQPTCGAFVSLKRHGQLRGCCGFLGASVPLVDGLRHAAGRTAVDDQRFPPVSVVELPHLDVEVWLLGVSEPVTARGRDRVAAVTVGRHGLTIARDGKAGLLLPGVAVEQAWSSEEFLTHVCLKAGLPPDAWLADDAQLCTFEGWSMRLPMAELRLPLDGLERRLPFSGDDLVVLARHAGQNILNLLAGSAEVPPPVSADARVCGAMLHVEGVNVGRRIEVARLDVRPVVALGDALVQLSRSAAAQLRGEPDLPRWCEQVRIGLTLFDDTALHGTVGDLHAGGLASGGRAAWVRDESRHGILFDPVKPVTDLVADAARLAGVSRPESAAVLSLAVMTTEPRVEFRHAPAPAPAPAAAVASTVRRPAQAGRFYPADPGELGALLDQFWQRPVPVARRWAACMVPHAGLVFSGHLAADVLRRVEIPDSILIIGPKHTPLGLDWAIAPYERWEIPGAALQGDLDLSRALARAVPGLVFDAAAHAGEHAIEVQLPIIARAAPRTRVAAIAIGRADLAQCREIAAGLAAVMRALPRPPLLVISSDMNHFADDATTRRLDALALAAMQRLDPAHLHDVVMANRISMCGLLPAVIVMEALRRLGGLTACTPVGYATSADVTGDPSRVVGYAGVVLG